MPSKHNKAIKHCNELDKIIPTGKTNLEPQAGKPKDLGILPRWPGPNPKALRRAAMSHRAKKVSVSLPKIWGGK